MDIILKNWTQLLFDRNATRFIRALAYHLVGQRREKSEQMGKCLKNDVLIKKVQINQQASELFGRIASVALDYTSSNGKRHKWVISAVTVSCSCSEILRMKVKLL